MVFDVYCYLPPKGLQHFFCFVMDQCIFSFLVNYYQIFLLLSRDSSLQCEPECSSVINPHARQMFLCIFCSNTNKKNSTQDSHFCRVGPLQLSEGLSSSWRTTAAEERNSRWRVTKCSYSQVQHSVNTGLIPSFSLFFFILDAKH